MWCGKKLKIFSVLSVLFFLWFCSPSCFSCYAEVILTEEEALQIQSELSQSKKELQKAKEEIQEQKNELLTVKDTYKEQKIFYEEQLNEVEKKNDTLEKVATVTTTTSVGLLIALLVILFI